MTAPAYIELHARSAFSFLRGVSAPGALAARAAELHLPALAVCDRMGVYGAPRFFSAARELGVRAIIGAELAMDDGSALPVLVESRAGYRNLCRLLTQAHLRAAKGAGVVRWEELPEFAVGLVALTGDEEGPLQRALTSSSSTTATAVTAEKILQRLVRIFGNGGVQVELQRHLRRGEDRIRQQLIALGRAHALPLLATNSVLHARPEERPVADVFSCLRHHTHLDAAGRRLELNDERHLKTARQMAALFADVPEAVTNTVRLGERLQFTLADLGYEFPKFPVGNGETMAGVLREWTQRGARGRYPAGVPEKVRALLEKELALIHKLKFDGYFLIVADLVRYCREHGIMAQGRGSAANSAVCFCLGITAVDPVRFNVLFERFLTESRKGWPDIDIDLPSGDQREQVIQEVYRRYGPHGAAMTANVITYRGRSTAREVGKVLNLPADVLERFSNLTGHSDMTSEPEILEHLERAGLARTHPRAGAFAGLCSRISGLPRHLGQHSGGMIICESELSSVMPLENASMPGRVVAQWDKDDCEDLGIIKVDLLGLGMMAALQETVTLSAQRGRPVDLAQLPENDPATYALLQRADTIGVFQGESRAPMATLPRLKPRTFYDLVVEVAIIRPGPIVGNLAHPYLRRRNGEEPVTYYAAELVPVLERTLGVPLFQEQMLQMAMLMANYSGDEAEELRRAMSFHRSDERMCRAQAQLRAAMGRAGVAPDITERIVESVGSFALYGFPESHAISFAHLAYASAYLKVHRGPEFFCALLNQQPMGFYSPATLVRDAKQRGVQVRPVCVARSKWECVIEPDDSIRLGLVQVEGVRRAHAQAMLQARAEKPFGSLDDFKARTPFGREELRTLAEIGGLNTLAEHRRAALWEVERVRREDDLLTAPDGASPLRAMTDAERLRADYNGLRLTTGPHPMALIRERLPDVTRAADLADLPNGRPVRVAGQVICRQRPGTAKGICFVSLEDESGISNAIVSPELFEAERLTITGEPFLIIDGVVQARHGTIHIKARSVHRLDHTGLRASESHDFR